MIDWEGKEHADNVSTELFRVICGTKIGHGGSRVVYRCRLDDDIVIKIETNPESFNNVSEWRLWQSIRILNQPRVEKWFAPCLHISPCGVVLIQQRTYPVNVFPKKIPVWLSDTKTCNYGKLSSGKFVCHDYGEGWMTDLYGLYNEEMKQAEWRHE